MERNIALKLMYNGTAYHGWQVQKNAISVAETLEKALSTVVCHPVKCTGAGRTDAGVHAETYIANFRTTSTIPCDRIPLAVNTRLPNDIVVVKATEVSDEFNAIGSCLKKEYTYPDPVGVEIGGAVKNVIAIAVGCSDGMGFGDNTRAALITRGLAEMKRFVLAYGGLPDTLSGLAGTGDLIVTCTSVHSRNHSVGERLGRGEKIDDILGSMQMVAEGVWNSKVVHEIARKLGVEMPICDLVYALCYEDFDAKKAVAAMMGRELKSE